MTTNSSTALITGGTSGIGRASADKLATLGIHVIVVGRNADRGERTIREIRAAGGQADFISSDLRDVDVRDRSCRYAAAPVPNSRSIVRILTLCIVLSGGSLIFARLVLFQDKGENKT